MTWWVFMVDTSTLAGRLLTYARAIAERVFGKGASEIAAVMMAEFLVYQIGE